MLLLSDGFRLGGDASSQVGSGKGRLEASITRKIALPVHESPETGLLASRSPVTKDPAKEVAIAPEASGGVVAEKKSDSVLQRSLDDYLPPSRLDKLPKPLGNVEVGVDFKALKGLVGEAEIMLLISSSGDVDDVLVTESTLPDFLVAEAVGYFRGLRFDPGMVSETNVRSRIRIRLTPPSNDELLANPYSAKEKAWKR